ncbi:MAG: family 16 glycoside hydrolase [Bacteroidota bacterium]
MEFLNISTLVFSLLYLAGCSSTPNNNSQKQNEDLAPSSEWVELFDGNSLDGWEQKNGTASYKVLNGTIVGTTAEGSPNSFLCTQKGYGDFELTFEVKVDKELNSGVQIRSKTREESIGDSNNEAKGRVIGPQVEIVEGDETGGLSGYIWREATGDGWMGEEQNKHDFFKGGDWNQYRILAKGPQITTWINGHQVEDVNDPDTYVLFPSGFISLQVHGIGEREGPFKVSWKNIKIREL